MSPNRIARRTLLGGLSAFGATTLLGARAWAEQEAAQTAAKDDAPRTLLLVQLSGGNDGLSTVVPHGDDAYHAARPSIAIAPADVLKLDDYRGLHPALARLRAAFDAGHVAIVEGAGYPDPIRSHFKSLDVWHTADPRGQVSGDGWIGKLVASAWREQRDPNLVVHVGANVPYSLHSRTHPPSAFVNPASYRWAGGERDTEAYAQSGEMGGAEKKESNLDYLRQVLADSQASSIQIRRAAVRYKTAVAYPDDAFGQSLRDVAALVNGNLGTRVFSVELSGFDTHTNQRGEHELVMRTLDAGLGALLEDFERSAAGKNVAVLVFSEFGRRVKENGSRGTDHGVAGPMLVLGAGVKGGLYGKHPSLTELDSGDLAHTTDFRRVYATLIERWLGAKSDPVLGARYEPLGCLA